MPAQAAAHPPALKSYHSHGITYAQILSLTKSVDLSPK